jgi:phenylacetate-coenzyme A ligase PaaK-like adenylate-forming protein
MFAVPRDQIVRIHASSGTTGKPTVVGYTRKDIDTWADVVARSIRAAARGRATWCTELRLRPVHRRLARTTGPSAWA